MAVSLLALGALAVLAVSGAVLVSRLRKKAEPAPGSDEWFAQQGIIPLITDANRKNWEARSERKPLSPWGDVVGYFAEPSAPAVGPRPTLPPSPNPLNAQRQYQTDTNFGGPQDDGRPSEPVRLTPAGLLGSIGQPTPIGLGGRDV